jgi:acetyl esterase/lipase
MSVLRPPLLTERTRRVIEQVLGRTSKLLVAALLFAAGSAAGATDREFLAKTHRVVKTEGVKFGDGGVAFAQGAAVPGFRDLLVDVYQPADPGSGPRPAMILAFGGAHQRGSRKNDFVAENGQYNSSISEYCHEFARRGYVCFAIDYRLMPEDPTPGETPTIGADDQFDFDRINVVRGFMKLPPANREMVVRAIEAATDDMTLAATFVRAQSKRFNIDVNRIVVGGFSAGANTAMNAAFAERLPVAAVVALSGAFTPSAVAHFITAEPKTPPLLLFMGENDLPDLTVMLPATVQRLAKAGAAYELVRVPNAGHFYPRTAKLPGPDGGQTSVEDRMAAFLYKHLRLGNPGSAD